MYFQIKPTAILVILFLTTNLSSCFLIDFKKPEPDLYNNRLLGENQQVGFEVIIDSLIEGHGRFLAQVFEDTLSVSIEKSGIKQQEKIILEHIKLLPQKWFGLRSAQFSGAITKAQFLISNNGFIILSLLDDMERGVLVILEVEENGEPRVLRFEENRSFLMSNWPFLFDSRGGVILAFGRRIIENSSDTISIPVFKYLIRKDKVEFIDRISVADFQDQSIEYDYRTLLKFLQN